MKVKKSNSSSRLYGWGSKPKKIGIFVIFFLFIVKSFVSLTYGYLKFRNGYQLKNVYDFVLNPVSTFSNFVKGKFSPPKTIYIDIKFKDFQRIQFKRAIAIEKKVLETGGEDYVPASITYLDKELKAKIRLKGDWATNVAESDKWSYRIKISGDETMMGMKVFSIHHPKERNFIYEWLYHQALKDEDVLNLKYDFIKVVLNGKDLGIYAIEEHFDKIMIERNDHHKNEN